MNIVCILILIGVAYLIYRDRKKELSSKGQGLGGLGNDTEKK